MIQKIIIKLIVKILYDMRTVSVLFKNHHKNYDV